MLRPPSPALSSLAKPGGCPGGAEKGHYVPRPGPFRLVLGADNKEEVPAASWVVGHVGGASKPGICLWAPWTEGLSPAAVFFSPRVTDGIGRAKQPGANTPAQSWQGQRPQHSLAYTGTHVIQVVTPRYKYLTP